MKRFNKTDFRPHCKCIDSKLPADIQRLHETNGKFHLGRVHMWVDVFQKCIIFGLWLHGDMMTCRPHVDSVRRRAQPRGGSDLYVKGESEA